MSQHSQDTQQGPSLGPIIGGMVFAGVVFAATVYTATGEVTRREMVGSMLGVVLTVLLIFQTAGRVLDRLDADRRRFRARERVERETLVRTENTGTWYGPDSGRVLTVRYEPHSGRFWVHGWLSDQWTVRRETRWTDMDGLITIIQFSELVKALEPARDPATRLVRQRLGLAPLPGEERPETTGPVGGDGWPRPVDGEGAEGNARWGDLRHVPPGYGGLVTDRPVSLYDSEQSAGTGTVEDGTARIDT